MFKKLIGLVFSALLTGQSQAQQLLGIANSNYAETNGLYMNPSSIADSQHGFYLNFFTIDELITNNYLQYTGPDLKQSLADNYFGKDDFYLQEKINGKPKVFTFAADLRLPSFMLRLSPKHSIAFASRSRTAIQGSNVSEDMMQLIRDGADNSALQNLPVDGQLGFNANSFLETGVSYARVLVDKEKHFVKGVLLLNAY